MLCFIEHLHTYGLTEMIDEEKQRNEEIVKPCKPRVFINYDTRESVQYHKR